MASEDLGALGSGEGSLRCALERAECARSPLRWHYAQAQRVAEVGNVEGGATAELTAGQVEHRGTEVEGSDRRTIFDEPFREQAGATAGFKNTQPSHVAEQVDCRGPLIVALAALAELCSA